MAQFDPNSLSWREVVEMQQRVHGNVGKTHSEVHDVLGVNELGLTCSFLEILSANFVFIAFLDHQVSLLGRCGIPFDKGRGKYLQTGVTELELKYLVNARRTRNEWVRAFDFTVIHGLL